MMKSFFSNQEYRASMNDFEKSKKKKRFIVFNIYLKINPLLISFTIPDKSTPIWSIPNHSIYFFLVYALKICLSIYCRSC